MNLEPSGYRFNSYTGTLYARNFGEWHASHMLDYQCHLTLERMFYYNACS